MNEEAKVMETKIKKNDHKGSLLYILLLMALDEFEEALNSFGPMEDNNAEMLIEKCVDLDYFMMIIAENARRKENEK